MSDYNNLENNKRNTDYAAAAGQMSSLLFTAIFSLYLYVMKPLFTSYHAELLKSLTTHSTLHFEHLGLHEGGIRVQKSGILAPKNERNERNEQNEAITRRAKRALKIASKASKLEGELA